jgi:hypothetical protein
MYLFSFFATKALSFNANFSFRAFRTAELGAAIKQKTHDMQ